MSVTRYKLNLRVPFDLEERLRAQALVKNVSMNALVLEILREGLWRDPVGATLADEQQAVKLTEHNWGRNPDQCKHEPYLSAGLRWCWHCGSDLKGIE